MIIKGGSRANGAFFAAHLLRTDTNERVSVLETRGLVADDIEGAFQEIAGVAAGARAKNFFYIASLNPTADEHLTREQWLQSADMLERHLGLDGQQRVIVLHEKDGRTHGHVFWNRIDLDTMTAISDSLTYPKHEAAAREMEREFGLEPVESVLVRDREGERPERRPRDWESFRAADTGIDPQAMKAEITALWQEADSGQAFKAALEDAGYILARGDRRDFCIIDRAGDEHSLARRISGAKAAEIRARLADIDREALPSVAEARELAIAAAGDTGGDAGPSDMQPGEWQPTTPPEEPGTQTLAEPEPAGQMPPVAQPAESADDGITRTQAEDDAPERVSPWGSAWRAFADHATQFAEQLYELWKDETSGARADRLEPGADKRSWVSRVMEAGHHIVHGWRHSDAEELAEGLIEAAAFVHDLTRPDPPPTDASAQAPPEESGGDLARPSGKVEPPAPDEAPQESATAPLTDIGAAYGEALRQADEPQPSYGPHPSHTPQADAPTVPSPSGPERDGPDFD